MKTTSQSIVWTAAGLVLALTVVVQPAVALGNADTSCCYTNPRFAGVCKVEPSGDETCASILAFLNNQQAVGKTYCGNTKVRGGWKKVTCEEGGQGAEARSCSTPAPLVDLLDASVSTASAQKD